MQTQINAPLQALLQTAAMVTPSGGDTVAAQVAQTAQQKMQAQTMPPGIAALMPGVRQQAMQSAQAAQPATQGDVNQLRQVLAQAQQNQGIAAGADVEMAEGGIVGYASRGYVDPQFPEVYENYTPPDLREPTTGLEEEELFGKTPRQRAIEKAEEELLGPMGRPVAAKPRPERKPPVRTAPAPERGTQPRPQAAAQAAAAESGLPSLMGPQVPTGSERQFAEALAAQGRIQLPPERTAQQVRTEREDYYRSLGIDPDFARSRLSRIEAQEARDRAEAEERAKFVKDRGMENLISRLTRAGGARSGLAGLAQAQLGMEPIIAAQRASDERFSAVMRERQIAADKERTATEDMQRALADGDIARAEKSRNDALAARNAKNEAEARIRAQYAPQLLQSETAALGRESRERQSAASLAQQAKIEGARLKQQAEQNGQMQLANRINAANITVSSAIERMDRDLEKRFGTTIKMYQMMNPDDLKNKPALAAGYQQYMQEREKIYRTAVEPAVRERDRLAAMINSGQDLSKWGEPTVKTGR